MRRRPYAITKRDMLVVIFVVCVLLAMLMPSLVRVRERANRIKCADRLKMIGQAIVLYSNDNKGLYPKTIAQRGPTVIPTWGTGATASDPFGPGGPEPNDVSAALYLLLRTQDITGDVFICPSTSLKPWKFGGVPRTGLDWSNWPDVTRQLSYSYQNPYPDDPSIQRSGWTRHFLPMSIAVAADMNPGIVAGQQFPAVQSPTTLPTHSGWNSQNHAGDGQNVLYGDGHVSFETTPFVGPLYDNLYDNIYTTRGGAVIASPYDKSDCILLPTAR